MKCQNEKPTIQHTAYSQQNNKAKPAKKITAKIAKKISRETKSTESKQITTNKLTEPKKINIQQINQNQANQEPTNQPNSRTPGQQRKLRNMTAQVTARWHKAMQGMTQGNTRQRS